MIIFKIRAAYYFGGLLRRFIKHTENRNKELLDGKREP